jgi:glycosyltransferase involved in cell wall biosynthesis
MRVLLVTKPLTPPWNDSGKVVPRDLALANGGRHELHVLTTRGDASAWPRGVRTHPVYPPARGGRPGPRARHAQMCPVWRLRREFDALHFFFQPHPAAAQAARLLSAACRLPSLHTALSAPRLGLAPGRILFSPLTVTLSRATADRLSRPGHPAPRVIPPGIAEVDPPAPGRVAAARGRLGLEAGFVVYPGDYDFSGGYDLLLEAWAGAPDLPPLLLAGRDKTAADSGVRAALERRAQELGLERRVRFAGTVEDMPALLAASSAVLFPARSLYAKSDVPIVLLEAWRSARPVWVSDLPPLRELLLGIADPLPPEPAAWAAAARSTAADGARLGEAGRARLLERYTAQRMRAAYEALYDELEAAFGAGERR